MGVGLFFYDDAEKYLDSVVCSDRDKRYIAEKVKQDATRLSAIMSKQYSDTTERLTGELDFAMRVSTEGMDRVDQVLEDLRDGDITAREAAAQLGAARRELETKVRPVVNGAAEVEERAWSEVNVSPGEHQRQIAKRMPAIFSEGRGLLQLPTFDND